MAGCPIHALPGLMRRLKTFAGLPVPHTILVENGKPDFRKPDIEKVRDCVKRKSCAICGSKLGTYGFYLGGPKSLANQAFTDAAMHLPCARASMVLCPFLKGDREHYRGALPAGPMDVSGRPAKMYLMKGSTANQKLGSDHNGYLIINSGPLTVLEEF
jgi:hypothetical protein